MTRDELEFSISQYLDGTLPDGERLMLEARFAQDAEARQLLAEYRQMEAVLKGATTDPDVRWDALAIHLSNAVAEAGATVEVRATGEAADVEYVASQYLDGTLSVEERAAFEIRLQVDASAAALLTQYRHLETVVKTSLPMPAVRWDALAEHLSDVVADAGAKPIFSFKWARTAGRIAIAACLLLGTALGIRTYQNSHNTKIAMIAPEMTVVPPTAVAIVTGPEFEQAAGKAVVEVEIGGPAVAQAGGTGPETAVDIGAGSSSQFADVVVSRPSRVIIATGENSAQDSAMMPY